MKLNTVFLAALACALVSARAVPQDAAPVEPAVVEPAVVEPAVVTPADPLNTGGAQVDPATAEAEPAADVTTAEVPADDAPADDAAPAAAAQNVLTSPTGGNLDGGAPITITWTPGNPDSPVSIALILGPDGAMQEIERIADAQPNSGSYTWNASKKLQDSTTITNGDQYGFEIIDDATGEGSYSAPFSLSVPESTFGKEDTEEEETVSSSVVESAAPTSTESSSSSSSSSAESSSATPTSTESSASTTATSSAKPKETDADEDDEPTKSTTTDAAASSPTETDDPNNTPLPTSSGPPIGPIVGGVFGGFAALAFLIVGGLYLSRRMRKEKTKREMRTSGFLRNMEAVDREHAEYMKQHGSVKGSVRGSVKESPAEKYERTQGMSNAF